MPGNAPYAVVTPYYQEERAVIERCIASVRRQTVHTDHFLIADGFPQDWIDTVGVRHLRLDRGHGDNGNTPRGIGALLAIAEGYNGIGLLDADNWFSPDHVEACLAAATRGAGPCDYVIAQRTFRRLDESIMPIAEPPDHVDTSCYFFLRGAFSTLPHWAMMPRKLSPACDRFFNYMLSSRGLVAAHVIDKPTVHFQTLYEAHYRALGEAPPPGAKPNVGSGALKAWLHTLPPREKEVAARLMGYLPAREDRPIPRSDPRPRTRIGRNEICPCGSGRKYKHCHGAA